MNPLNIQTNAQGTFVTYKLNPEENIDRMTMGMLRNNDIKGFVSIDYSQIDAERWIKYDVTSMIPIQTYMSGVLTRKKALDMFSQVVTAFVLAEDYMIDASFIILDGNYVFVNPNTGEIGILCLPLEGFVANVTLRDFIGNVTRQGQFNPQENCDYVTKILNFVNGTNFSVIGFKKLLDQLISESVLRVQKDPVADANAEMAVSVESVANMVSHNMDPGTQGIWGAGGGVSGQTPPAKGMGAPVGPMGTGAGAMAGATPMSAPKKEKKSLFGKKKKKEVTPAVPPSPGSMSGGMAIPGMEVPGMKIPGAPPATGGSAPMTPPAMTPPPMGGNGKKGPSPMTPPPMTPPAMGGAGSKGPSLMSPSPMTPPPMTPPMGGMINNGPKEKKKSPIKLPGMKSEPENIEPTMGAFHGAKQLSGGDASISSGANLTGIASQIAGGTPRQTTSSQDKPEWSISPELANGVGVADGTIMLNLNNNEPPAMLKRVRTGETVTIERDELVMGKDRNSVDYCIENNTTVSRVHAKIIKRGKQYYIKDNNSMNHTYVNGVQVYGGQEHLLESGCNIRLSDEDFTFTAP